MKRQLNSALGLPEDGHWLKLLLSMRSVPLGIYFTFEDTGKRRFPSYQNLKKELETLLYRQKFGSKLEVR